MKLRIFVWLTVAAAVLAFTVVYLHVQSFD